MAIGGAIAERVRGILPATWDMLLGDSRYGETLLRSTIDTVKDSATGSVVAPMAESSLPLIVIDYLAKLSALQLITPGIDAWRTEPIVVSATGTNENTTYSDAVAALTQLRKDLLAETRQMWPQVAPLINFSRNSGGPRPLSSTIDDEFLTASPQEFPRPYRVTDRS